MKITIKLSEEDKKKRNNMRSKEWSKEYPEKIKANSKEWRKNNLEKARASSKKWAKDNPEKTKARKKQWAKDNPENIIRANLKHEYNITLEDYNKMLTLQVSGCTICGKTITENGKALAVDHNHKTGQVRGLLCTKCNHALGFMNDSSEQLRKAAAYLDKYKN